MKIDLNSDLGESFGAYKIGNDEELLSIVTSANIACGFHAGDPLVMQKTVENAVRKGCSIGAHPGLPDLVGFGRRKMAISYEDAYALMVYQIGALASFAKANGVKLQHVKPHGALYNMAAVDKSLASAIANAVYDVDRELILFASYGSEMLKIGEEKGLRTASEVFADRRYRADGTLVSRNQPGAVLEDENETLEQAVLLVKEGKVKADNGEMIEVKADTICVHGDTPGALSLAKKIRKALEEEGIEVASFR